MFDKMTAKVMNRRSLLAGAAVLGMGIGLAACSSDQLAQAEADWANVVGKIQSAVAQAATYVPTIESIAATAASLFGSQYASLVQIGSAFFNQIVATLVNVVGALSPAAASAVRRKLGASSPTAPVAVGVTSTGVTVIGWKAA